MELVPEDHRRAGCLIAHSACPKPAYPVALTGCVPLILSPDLFVCAKQLLIDANGAP